MVNKSALLLAKSNYKKKSKGKKRNAQARDGSIQYCNAVFEAVCNNHFSGV